MYFMNLCFNEKPIKNKSLCKHDKRCYQNKRHSIFFFIIWILWRRHLWWIFSDALKWYCHWIRRPSRAWLALTTLISPFSQGFGPASHYPVTINFLKGIVDDFVPRFACLINLSKGMDSLRRSLSVAHNSVKQIMKLLDLLGNYDGPIDQPTDRQTDRQTGSLGSFTSNK